MGEIRTLYSILGVAPNAGSEAIETAYREQREALERNGGDVDELSLLRVAYDTLKNPSLRQRYDARQATLAAEAASVVVVPDGPETRVGQHRRSGFLRVLCLLLIVVSAYWGFMPKAAPPQPAARVIAVSTPAPPPDESIVTTAVEPPAETRQSSVPPPPSPPVSIEDESPMAVETMTRPARSPGFDAQYLAWSAYFVVRPRAVTGSGVMVATDRILTNCHVLAGAGLSGIAVMNSVTRRISRVTEYARLEDDDACLLHAPGAGSDAVEWGTSATLKSGDPTHTFGHPGGSSNLVWSYGVFVRRMPTNGRGEDILVTNNYCRPGSSGGPLFDGEGRLVGVVAAVQRFTGKGQDNPYGLCASVTEATARELLRKPLFPVAMAPSFYKKNY
jgi:S1-C subfamily serine protease